MIKVLNLKSYLFLVTLKV